MKENSKALLYTAIAIASWSTVASAFKIGLRHYGAFELILVSAITATLLFAGVLTFQRKWHLLKGLNRRELGSYAFTGLLNPALYYLILFRSYDLLPAQVAQPINYFWPILLALLLAVIEKRPVPLFKFAGMIISFGGVVLPLSLYLPLSDPCSGGRDHLPYHLPRTAPDCFGHPAERVSETRRELACESCTINKK
jgi:drug/metabolite transporter (DMT)-like permease